MTRPGYKLRLALLGAGIETPNQSAAIADLLGHSVEWVRDRISGRRSWTIREAVAICEEFGLEKDDIHEMFM